MKTWMDERRFQEWYQTATQDEKNLLERVEEFAIHFDDMIFSTAHQHTILSHVKVS